jgi:hypothetical protein
MNMMMMIGKWMLKAIYSAGSPAQYVGIIWTTEKMIKIVQCCLLTLKMKPFNAAC